MRQNAQLDRMLQNQREKYSGQEQTLKRENSDLKKENKALLKRIRSEQEANVLLDQDREILAEKLPVIEELEDERNNLLEEV